MKLKSQRNRLGHQYGLHFIVLGHHYGRRDVTCKRPVQVLILPICLAGVIADVTHVYGPAFYSAGGIMILGSSLVFLARFIKQEGLNEDKREELHDSLECFVYERETVL